eukprot:scaffold6555_cov182-Amphora_coffeaeformis.AAC.11
MFRTQVPQKPCNIVLPRPRLFSHFLAVPTQILSCHPTPQTTIQQNELTKTLIPHQDTTSSGSPRAIESIRDKRTLPKSKRASNVVKNAKDKWGLWCKIPLLLLPSYAGFKRDSANKK